MALVQDNTSFANFKNVRVEHCALELDVNFDKKVVDGYAKLSLVKHDEACQLLVVDTRDLNIHHVDLIEGEASSRLSYQFGAHHPVLGTPLEITLPVRDDLKLDVGIRFTTSSTSTALQFLAPEQTAGGVHPYLFTQCQAIHARSFVPCQDTPAVKMTYSAAVRVPAPLTALMSAVPREGGTPSALTHLPLESSPGIHNIFLFSQTVPIPAYLLALAVGDLTSRDISPITRVWSEPSMVEAGQFEFAETAKFLEAGEAIAGPYVWGRYDLLLLPPSFPYGGMENPCLTFVTPTLLAGDRSLTHVVAHEISHSWTGNLVTNASWEHFWLNEGWTVYLERRILGRVYGDQVLQFRAAQGYLDLQEDVHRIGADHPYTQLYVKLEGGGDPDDSFSKVPYEKGFYFLYYLQQLVGGPATFDPFIKDYLSTFKYRTVTSEEFCDFFMEYFKDHPQVASVDWDHWYFSPGMPPTVNQYDTSLAQCAYDLAKRWHTSDIMGIGREDLPPELNEDNVQGWSSDQLACFLNKLGELRSLTPMHASMTRKMSSLYHLDDQKNSEVRCSWYKVAIAAEDSAVLPGVVDMLKTQGRMKFLRPLYRALFKSKMGHQLALDTFHECKNAYHPIASKMVAADLKLA